jgi:hypothetical protein
MNFAEPPVTTSHRSANPRARRSFISRSSGLTPVTGPTATPPEPPSANLYDRLIQLTIRLLHERAKRDPVVDLAAEFDLGVCISVADCAVLAAQRLGIRAKRRSGRVVTPSGRIVPEHAWLELLDGSGLILDSPDNTTLMIASAADRGATYWPVR